MENFKAGHLGKKKKKQHVNCFVIRVGKRKKNNLKQ